MKHFLATLGFAVSVIAVSIYGMLRPSYDLSLFLDLGTAFARLRIMLALVLVLYVLVPQARVKVTQIGMLIGGSLCLTAGVMAIFSPMLFGTFSHYTTLGDVIIAIEGGVLAVLSALQLSVEPMQPAKTPLFMLMVPSYYLQQLSRLQPRKPLSSVSKQQLGGLGTTAA